MLVGCDNAMLPRQPGGTALHVALKYHRHDVAMTLLARGADVNVANDHGTTPVWFAAWFGSAPVLQAILDRGKKRQRPQSSCTHPQYACNHAV